MDYTEGIVKRYKRQYTRTLKDGSKKQYTTEQSQVTISKNDNIFENGEKVLVLKEEHKEDLDNTNKLLDNLDNSIANGGDSDNIASSSNVNNVSVNSKIGDAIDNNKENINNESQNSNNNIDNFNGNEESNDDYNSYDTIIALEIYNYILNMDKKNLKKEVEEAINRNAELSVKIRTMERAINSSENNIVTSNSKNTNSIHSTSSSDNINTTINNNNNGNNGNGNGNNRNNINNSSVNINNKNSTKSIEKLENSKKDYRLSKYNGDNYTNVTNNTSFNNPISNMDISSIVDVDIEDLDNLDFDEIIDKFSNINNSHSNEKNIETEIFKYKEEKLRKEYEHIYNAAKNEISYMQKHIRSFESQQSEKYNNLKAKYKNVVLEKDLLNNELKTASSEISYLENINR
ncbi:MAG: hypothetical protein ACRCVG_02970, partial [Methanobacteriaceae archaeon]